MNDAPALTVLPEAGPDDGPAPGPGVLEILRRQWRGENQLDKWGADDELIDLLLPLFTMRLRIEVEGAHRLPADGPCVLVANRVLGLQEPVVVLETVRRATGRRARFLGIPDRPFIGPALRRLGGAVDRPEELAGLLRAGNVVMELLSRREKGRAGAIEPEALQPALDLGVPVVPIALVGSPLPGRWTVHVGDPVKRPPGKGPFSLYELATSAQDAVQALLDEANPPVWLLG